MLPAVVCGGLCIMFIIGLLICAFVSDLPEGIDVDCISSDDSVVSESLNVLLMFMLGYLCTLATKNRHTLGRQTQRVIHCCNTIVSSAFSCIASMGDRIRESRPVFEPSSWISKDVLAITSAATLCSLCIGGLLVSAFTIDADADPADSGFASDESASMKAFTVGWMFVLSFKLRRELVGCVGSSWLLQPI
jgi:hypothetical protein